MRQFAVIVAMVCPGYPPADTAALYRDAFALGHGVVDYDAFCAAAEARQLFSHCLRLAPACGAERAASLTTLQAAQLFYIVDGHVRCLDHDLAPWLAQLPRPWARVVEAARAGVAAALEEAQAPAPAVHRLLAEEDDEGGGGGGHRQANDHADGGGGGSDGAGSDADEAPSTAFNLQPDGRRALVAYRRYLDLLLYMRGCNRGDRGEAGGPRALRAVQEELGCLEQVLRLDPTALAPDAATIRRMARAGMPLRLATVVRGRKRSTVVITLPGEMAATAAIRRGSAAVAGAGPAASAFPLSPPGPGDAVGPEEYAARLGIDAYADDPMVAMRSHEAQAKMQAAAKTAAIMRMRSLMRHIRLAMTLQGQQQQEGPSAAGGMPAPQQPAPPPQQQAPPEQQKPAAAAAAAAPAAAGGSVPPTARRGSTLDAAAGVPATSRRGSALEGALSGLGSPAATGRKG
jgi:hypothetical protein